MEEFNALFDFQYFLDNTSIDKNFSKKNIDEISVTKRERYLKLLKKGLKKEKFTRFENTVVSKKREKLNKMADKFSRKFKYFSLESDFFQSDNYFLAYFYYQMYEDSMCSMGMLFDRHSNFRIAIGNDDEMSVFVSTNKFYYNIGEEELEEEDDEDAEMSSIFLNSMESVDPSDLLKKMITLFKFIADYEKTCV